MAYTTIDNPGEYFNTVLWTGDGVNGRSLTGVGFQPDWVWSKCTSHAVDHGWQDSVRGVGKVFHSNSTTAEGTDNWITALNSDGFTLSNSNEVNQDTRTFVAWNWKAGTAFSNDASSTGVGSIDSSGSVNTTAGFSIIIYTGTGSSATVAHGLGVAPNVIITKKRNGTAQPNFQNSMRGYGEYLALSTTEASQATGGAIISAASSTTYSCDGNDVVNLDSATYVSYCFAQKQGYSKFGSYVGNGNANGPHLYTGFKPAFIILKRTDSANNWHLADNKRLNPYNVTSAQMYPNLANAHAEQADLDILSNGFKIRQAHAFMNASGGAYIYMAFAENPFVTSKGVPTTAR